MSRAIAIANRIREVLLNGHWVANTNYKELLSVISWEQATQKVGELNSIAALTYHINYYLAGLNEVLRGGELKISDKYSFDCPVIDSASSWEKLRNELFGNAEIFANHVEQMPDEKLDSAFVNEKYGSWLRNIEGVIEHCYYHLGQISLIRKIIG